RRATDGSARLFPATCPEGDAEADPQADAEAHSEAHRQAEPLRWRPARPGRECEPRVKPGRVSFLTTGRCDGWQVSTSYGSAGAARRTSRTERGTFMEPLHSLETAAGGGMAIEASTEPPSDES